MATSEYARLEERILARDQKGASNVLYRLMKQSRPLTEITRETVPIHTPYTHVPYHQRLDDGIVKFVNNDHRLLSERVGLPLASIIRLDIVPRAALASRHADRGEVRLRRQPSTTPPAVTSRRRYEPTRAVCARRGRSRVAPANVGARRGMA